MVRDFKIEPITEEEVLNCYWYAIFDNTIGGWAISNVEREVSDLNPYEGRFELGSFLTESEAKHIARIHNAWWDNIIWESYWPNIIKACVNEAIDHYHRALDSLKDVD